VAVCIVVNSIIAILSIVSAKYFAIVLNDFLPQNDFKNIIILSLAFVLVYLLEIGGQYFANIFYNRKRMKSFNILSYRLLTVLGNKNSDFYQKINNEQFYMLNNICSSISEFHTTAIPMFITSNIFMLTTFIIIAAYNPLFILIALLIIITNGLIFIYDFKMKKKVNTKIINLDFKNISLTNDFINNKNNSIETALTINKMKENLSEINSLTNFKFSYENNINFFGHIGTRIINMILIILSVYLINKDDFSIPNLIYIFMIFEIFESNIRQTLNFINKKIEFDRYNEMYKTMIEINNDEAKLVIVFDQNTNFSKEYIKNNANTLVLKM
jgi:ABC-type bacteriocin/lantibiotic exporter with double-glycine peptidase domain